MEVTKESQVVRSKEAMLPITDGKKESQVKDVKKIVKRSPSPFASSRGNRFRRRASGSTFGYVNSTASKQTAEDNEGLPAPPRIERTSTAKHFNHAINRVAPEVVNLRPTQSRPSKEAAMPSSGRFAQGKAKSRKGQSTFGRHTSKFQHAQRSGPEEKEKAQVSSPVRPFVKKQPLLQKRTRP